LNLTGLNTKRGILDDDLMHCLYISLADKFVYTEDYSSFKFQLTSLNQSCQFKVNYEFNTSTGSLDMLNGKEHFKANLSLLLRWSPYSSEADLLKQVSFYVPLPPPYN